MRPNGLSGMRHVALFVREFERCQDFYTRLLGMKVEWCPDQDNVYLCSGCDNLALHRLPQGVSADGHQRLDHIGFVIEKIEQVDDWYQYFLQQSVPMKTQPRSHRDGARSFYCYDPDGTVVQMIYHPPISTVIPSTAN